MMQTSNILKATFLQIEYVCPNFLWGMVDGRKKSSVVKWDDIYHPKENGVLGLRKLHDYNIAFLMELC